MAFGWVEAGWQRRLFCADCDKWSVYDDGFQDEFFRNYQPCHKCGSSKHLVAKIVRWEAEPSIWWRPSTWNRGKWIEREEG